MFDKVNEAVVRLETSCEAGQRLLKSMDATYQKFLADREALHLLVSKHDEMNRPLYANPVEWSSLLREIDKDLSLLTEQQLEAWKLCKVLESIQKEVQGGKLSLILSGNKDNFSSLARLAKSLIVLIEAFMEKNSAFALRGKFQTLRLEALYTAWGTSHRETEVRAQLRRSCSEIRFEMSSLEFWMTRYSPDDLLAKAEQVEKLFEPNKSLRAELASEVEAWSWLEAEAERVHSESPPGTHDEESLERLFRAYVYGSMFVGFLSERIAAAEELQKLAEQRCSLAREKLPEVEARVRLAEEEWVTHLESKKELEGAYNSALADLEAAAAELKLDLSLPVVEILEISRLKSAVEQLSGIREKIKALLAIFSEVPILWFDEERDYQRLNYDLEWCIRHEKSQEVEEEAKRLLEEAELLNETLR